MEIVGKIISVLPLQEGVSKTGNPWKLQSYVMETQEQYPRKVCFEVFGADRIAQNTCAIDDVVTVSFDIESREYNGRWYTSIRAWRIQQGVVDSSSSQPMAAQTMTHQVEALPTSIPASPICSEVTPFDPAAGKDESGDLPF